MGKKNKNLFVDSNIFLDFYHFSSEDLDALNELSKLIKANKIVLFLPQQVMDEVKRNRDNKVLDALKLFRESKPKIRFPQICKPYEEYDEVKRELGSLEKSLSELDSKLWDDISKEELKADDIIKRLFNIAYKVKCEDIIEAARARVDLGNPPGKKNSYGDAINWEALLDAVPQSEDLYFISGDRDYQSPLAKDQFNSFLLIEWFQKKKSWIKFYTSLSAFFQDHYSSIKLEHEREKNDLIAELFMSGSFTNTHSLISKLNKYVDFNDQQVELLVEAALENSQINLIARDYNVLSFYKRVTKNRLDFLAEDDLNFFNSLFYDNNEVSS